MPKLESEWYGCRGNPFQFSAIYGHVDIASQARFARIALRHLKVHSHASDNPVGDPSTRERGVQSLHAVEEFLHMNIVGGGSNHSQSLLALSASDSRLIVPQTRA